MENFSKRKAFDKPKKTRIKKVISAQKNGVKLSYKKSSMRDVIKDAIRNARGKKEGESSMYAFYHHLPSVQDNYLNSEEDKITLRLPQWKETPVQLQTCMYQLAMAETEANTEKELIPFTFILSSELSQKSIQYSLDTKKAETDYIRKRLSDSLRRSLLRDKGDAVEFWFALEFAPKNATGFPHIQGSILLFPHEIKNSREAFYRLSKKYTEGDVDKSCCLRYSRKKRSDLITQRGQLATDLNWASYNTKELARGRYMFTGDRRNTSARKSVISRATELYSELRTIHKATPLK